jgi:apolipoprotein N-acyltransferase
LIFNKKECGVRHTTFPIALIALGAVLLAEAMDWIPPLQSIWPIALILVGGAILISEGINRSSIVAGSMLIYIGIAWIVHEQHLASHRILVAIGLIVLGLALFVGRLPGVPSGRRPRRERTIDPPP